jgi:hypothetical protein
MIVERAADQPTLNQPVSHLTFYCLTRLGNIEINRKVDKEIIYYFLVEHVTSKNALTKKQQPTFGLIC